jgi:hypothetical protein
MKSSTHPWVWTQRLRLSWTRWSRTRKLKRLVREQKRLTRLQHLLEEQQVRVGTLVLDLQQERQERQMLLGVPTEEMVPETETEKEPPPAPPPLLRAIPEPPTEPESDPMEELAQRLGLQVPQS